MPSYAELASLCGFKSKNAAYKLVDRLVRERVLEKSAGGKLIPLHLFGEIKILGVVEAGFPATAEEELIDSINLDDFLVDDKEATYMLRVKGDSMINAGIREGDLVLVERGKIAKEGDIVIAEVDGEWTMKYLRKKAGRSYLEPANERYPLIFPKGEMKIAAVVRVVIRKY